MYVFILNTIRNLMDKTDLKNETQYKSCTHIYYINTADELLFCSS